jgi:hypothetical protein
MGDDLAAHPQEIGVWIDALMGYPVPRRILPSLLVGRLSGAAYDDCRGCEKNRKAGGPSYVKKAHTHSTKGWERRGKM